MRFRIFGISKGKPPARTTVDANCGIPLCFAAEHVLRRRWQTFLGEVGLIGNEAGQTTSYECN